MTLFDKGFVAVVIGVVSGTPVLAETNPQISKLMHEKQEKMAELEQCASKVQGFKIAGISTLGLTAVGLGATVAISNKNKGIETQIQATKSSITKQEKKLEEINAKIPEAERQKRLRDEAEAKKQAAEEAVLLKRQAACVGVTMRWDGTNCVCIEGFEPDAESSDLFKCVKKKEGATSSGTKTNNSNATTKTSKTSSKYDECIKNIKALLKIEGSPVGTLVVYNGSGKKVEIPSDNTKYYKDLATIAKDYSGTSIPSSVQNVACDKFVYAKAKVDEIFAEDMCIKTLAEYPSKYKLYFQTLNIFKLPLIENGKKAVDDGVFSKVEGDIKPCKTLKDIDKEIADLKEKTEKKKEKDAAIKSVSSYGEIAPGNIIRGGRM